MKTALSSKGQIVLPSELRREDGLEAGEQFSVERVREGEYRLVRLTPPANRGHELTVATRNVRDFRRAGARGVDPFGT